MDTPDTPKTLHPALLAIALAAVLGGALYWYWTSLRSQTETPSSQTVFSELVSGNGAFADATRLYNSGDYTGAAQKYQEALAAARNEAEAGQIAYKMALTKEQQGDYVGAIQGMKDIAANSQFTPIVKAYAVQRIGIIYNTYGYGRPEIVAETFTGDPYQSFSTPNDPELSYRKLFEYASSFYPLAIAESRIGDWYANALVKEYDAGKPPAALSEYIESIRSHVDKAEADIERVRSDPNAAGDIPPVFTRLGEIKGKLAYTGNGTLAEAESSFQTAMQLGALGKPGNDGYTRFQYASFLERYYGSERADDMRAILAPLSASEVYKGTAVMNFLASQRNTQTWMHRSLVEMAKVDAEFKALLVRLGWQAADFSS